MSETHKSIEQAAAEFRAEENERIIKHWWRAPRRVIYWPLYGLRYRLLMRTTHWFGYCYMKPIIGLFDDHGRIPHRCEWCGMQGAK